MRAILCTKKGEGSESRREVDKERDKRNEEGWEGMTETGRSYGEKGEIHLFVSVRAWVQVHALYV